MWVILEYCTGGDLRSMLKQDLRLPESAITLFGLDLMAGLHYLHTNGVLYCDLKPSNVRRSRARLEHAQRLGAPSLTLSRARPRFARRCSSTSTASSS